jgi:proline iminopeptidase
MVDQSKPICNTIPQISRTVKPPTVRPAIIHKKYSGTIGAHHPMTISVESLIFPAIEPYSTGQIATTSNHSIYYEECGNTNGMPVVVLHGGPGSGCTPGQRRFFDPHHYRIILFDQRGCGRSTPAGCTTDNTTPALVADIERLRQHLHIARWLVFGGSWGSTLALSYAACHPQQISGLILRGIFLARPKEIDWFLYQSRIFFPEAWEQLTAPLSIDERKDILTSYANRIFAETPSNIVAARRWNAFEASIMCLLPSELTNPPQDEITLARARVQLHYLLNGCFIADAPLLGQIDRFRHIPAIIVQGRYDMVCPISTAYELHQAWPEANFRVIPDAGHAAFEPGTAAALIAATEQFKTLS